MYPFSANIYSLGDATENFQIDHWVRATYIPNPLQTVPLDGHVVSWSIFVKTPGQVKLQMWRPTAGTMHLLVGENEYHPSKRGPHTFFLDEKDHIHVKMGDVMGISFTGTCPIPFSGMKCRDRRRSVQFFREMQAEVGGVYHFQSKPLR